MQLQGVTADDMKILRQQQSHDLEEQGKCAQITLPDVLLRTITNISLFNLKDGQK